jgi:hypothetical protein
MLKIEGNHYTHNVQIFADDTDPFQFYLLPDRVSWALNRDGKPNFFFTKYRMPITRTDGKKGGGLAFFAVELRITPEQEKGVREYLEERLRSRRFPNPGSKLKLGRPTFTRGTVAVQIMDSGGLLTQKINTAGVPSLFGNNVAAVAAEFTPEGATVFEQTMQRKGGGSLVMVNYALNFWARMPDSHFKGTWHAESSMLFKQQVDENNRFWAWQDDDYEEKIEQTIRKDESYKTEWLKPMVPVPGTDPGTHAKIVRDIEESLKTKLDEGIKRNILEAMPPADRDVSKLREQGYEHIKRTVDQKNFSDVAVEYKGAMVIELPGNPPGIMEAIGGLKVGGKELVWKDYAVEVDADDPFFREFQVVVRANADFKDIGIFDVQVTVDYRPPGNKPPRIETFAFKNTDEIGQFKAFFDGGNGEYTYTYTVNYLGETRSYTSQPKKSSAKQLTINVGELGVWVTDVEAGDINFDQVSSAQVAVWYEDTDVPRVERQFTITKETRKHSIRELIFKNRDKPYKYKVKYFLPAGREIETLEKTGQSQQLYINDPFMTRSLSIRTKGDFEARIDTIFLDFVYDDPANNLRQQKNFAFSKTGKRFEDWSFAVIDERAGKLTYTGSILYRDGSSVPIPEKTVTSNTVLEGEDPLKLDVELIPDLLDWSKLKLATIELSYEDAPNAIKLSKSFTLRKDAKPEKWSIDIKDKMKKSYTVKARYFMTDGSRKDVPPVQSSDTALVLEVPA